MQVYQIILNFSYHSLPCKSHAIHQSFFRNGKTCLLKHYNALCCVSNSELKHCQKRNFNVHKTIWIWRMECIYPIL